MKEKGAVPSSSLLISSAKLLAQSCPVPAARDGSACFNSATREQLASVGWAGKDTWWKCAELSPALPGSVKTAWASHSGIKNRAQYTQKCLPCLLSTRSELWETEVKCIAGSSVGCWTACSWRVLRSLSSKLSCQIQGLLNIRGIKFLILKGSFSSWFSSIRS